MTEYSNFIQDYPKRCADILEYFFLRAANMNREVTLLLMATAGGFIMPYERLIWGDTIRQPDIDRNEYNSAMEKLSNALGMSIKESHYFKEIICRWRFGKPIEPAGIKEIISAYASSNTIDTKMKIVEVLKIIRNSIAHGNIMSMPDNSNVIQDLIFISGGKKKNGTIIPYKMIVLTPKELNKFLLRWFEFLSKLPVPQNEVLRTIDKMAM